MSCSGEGDSIGCCDSQLENCMLFICLSGCSFVRSPLSLCPSRQAGWQSIYKWYPSSDVHHGLRRWCPIFGVNNHHNTRHPSHAHWLTCYITTPSSIRKSEEVSTGKVLFLVLQFNCAHIWDSIKLILLLFQPWTCNCRAFLPLSLPLSAVSSTSKYTL